MPEEAPRPPWSEEQWADLQQLVQTAARKARVASSFLPLHGPLAPGQTTVPALDMSHPKLAQDERQRGEAPERLDIDSGKTRRLITIASEVYLKTQQAEDPELAAARDMLGRTANVIGRLEDAIIFNGLPDACESVEPKIYTIDGREPAKYRALYDDGRDRIAGLLSSATTTIKRKGGEVSGEELVKGVVAAIQELEDAGHYGPFACVLSHDLYLVANTPNKDSMVLPSDRITPFLNGPLLRSSTITEDRGVVIALAAAPIDLVIASDIHVSFLQLSLEPRYVLRVSERFVLRMKQPDAVRVLEVEEERGEDNGTEQPRVDLNAESNSGNESGR
jgi:uncharacterized linocin/CFP29 family protein